MDFLSADLACEEEIDQALEEDRYDHITSTYFLLAERALVQQVLVLVQAATCKIAYSDFLFGAQHLKRYGYMKRRLLITSSVERRPEGCCVLLFKS